MKKRIVKKKMSGTTPRLKLGVVRTGIKAGRKTVARQTYSQP